MSTDSYKIASDKIKERSRSEFQGKNGVMALKSLLEESYGLEDTEKTRRLFDLAWEYGHASGAHEVLFYYDDMVDLIR